MLLLPEFARISLAASSSSRIALPVTRRCIATSRVFRQEDMPGTTIQPSTGETAKAASAESVASSLPGLDASSSSTASSSAAASSSTSPPPSPFIMPGSEASLNPFRQASQRFASRKGETFRLHIQATRNNILLTLTTLTGNIICHASGGAAGFKKSARGEYEAGYRASLAMFQKIEENRSRWGVKDLELVWKGFGKGREAAFRALLTQEGQATRSLVTSMRDATAIKMGGVRPRKRRML